MNDLFLNLKSPGWWLGRRIVSFLIQLASAYAKPLIEGFLATVSDRRRKKLEQAKIELNRQAEILASRPDGTVLLTLEQIKLMLFSFGILTFCRLFLLSVYIVPPNVSCRICAAVHFYLAGWRIFFVYVKQKGKIFYLNF
jgi:hypothetical protein